jgi:hypothetical protein
MVVDKGSKEPLKMGSRAAGKGSKEPLKMGRFEGTFKISGAADNQGTKEPLKMGSRAVGKGSKEPLKIAGRPTTKVQRNL